MLSRQPIPTSRLRATPVRRVRRVTTWSRRGCPPATWPKSSMYNNGSLLQAIKPEQNLTPLDDQPWASQLDPTFADFIQGFRRQALRRSVGTAFGGGVLYNIPVYKKLGLQIPKTWDEFMTNNARSRRRGIDPVEQTYGETWTSQLFVLGDFHNVEAQVPDFAAKYTASQAEVRHHAGRAGRVPAHPGGQRGRLPQQGLRLGQVQRRRQGGRHRQGGALPDARRSRQPTSRTSPRASRTMSASSRFPGRRGNQRHDVWPGAGMYIPKTVEGDKLDAAKKFIAFAATQPGCDAYAKGTPPQGPFLSRPAQLPGRRLAGRQGHYRPTSTPVRPARRWSSCRRSRARRWSRSASRWAPAQVTAKKGAALYDEDVKKQAQQLGLPGWELSKQPSGCRSLVTPPAAGLTRDRQQDLKKGLRHGEHTGHNRGDAPRASCAGAQRRCGSGRAPTRTGSIFPPRSSTSSSSSPRPSLSFYFSFTRWDLFTSTCIGLNNYRDLLQ